MQFDIDSDARRIFDALAHRFSRRHMDTWFAGARVARVTRTEVAIEVPNAFKQQWMTRQFQAGATEVASEVLGRPVAVVFESEAREPAPAAPEPPQAPATPARAPEPAAPPGPRPASPVAAVVPGLFPEEDDRPTLQPHYTFENFVVGPSNQIAHAAALAVTEDPGRANNPLFLYGSAGLGKSHLLQAICHEILRRRPGTRVRYVPCEQFTNEWIRALRHNQPDAFRERYRKLDLLVVDDVHFLAGKERIQEELFHTFNALYQQRHQIVLSSDAAPHDIPTFQERLVSRFRWGLVAEIEPPETETRMAIIRQKAESLSLALPDDIVEYVAQHVKSNIREIEGAIASIRARTLLERRPADLALAKIALDPMLRRDPPAVGVDRIAEVVAAHYGAKVADLVSKKRTKSVSLPRQVAMYLARTDTSLSLVEIGEFFGGRDHTTVLYATNRIAKQVEDDEGMRGTVERLRDRLGRRA